MLQVVDQTLLPLNLGGHGDHLGVRLHLGRFLEGFVFLRVLKGLRVLSATLILSKKSRILDAKSRLKLANIGKNQLIAANLGKSRLKSAKN